MVNLIKHISPHLASALTLALLALAPATAQATQFQLFGSQEQQSADLSAFTKWTTVMEKESDNRFESSACYHAACPETQWQQIITQTQGAGRSLQTLQRINSAVNRYTYIEDTNGWQQTDYWETPREFFQQGGGDCEDYAIVKYMALRALGWSADDMRIVVLKDTQINQMHSVLAVRLEGRVYILDNQRQQVTTDRQLTHYVPVYSINEHAWWRHSFA